MKNISNKTINFQKIGKHFKFKIIWCKLKYNDSDSINGHLTVG